MSNPHVAEKELAGGIQELMEDWRTFKPNILSRLKQGEPLRRQVRQTEAEAVLLGHRKEE